MTTTDQKNPECETCNPSSCNGNMPTIPNGIGGYTTVRCPEKTRHVLRGIIGSHGIPPRYRDASWSDYDNSHGVNRDTIERCRQWVKAYPHEDGAGIVLVGPVGTGKTHLAATVFAETILRMGLQDPMQEHRYPVFISTPTLIAKIRAGIDTGEAEEELQRAINAPLLVLDDVGAERVTEWTAAQLYRLVDARYSYMRPTIATTNLDPNGLASKLGERTASRLSEMCQWLYMGGDNMRKPQQIP